MTPIPKQPCNYYLLKKYSTIHKLDVKSKFKHSEVESTLEMSCHVM